MRITLDAGDRSADRPVVGRTRRHSTSRRPPLRRFLAEPGRGIRSRIRLALAEQRLASAPVGDGHGVLVIPGLLASDVSSRRLRAFLRGKGYQVYGWGFGRNVGPTPQVMASMPLLVERLVATTGGPVSLVGWSMGGIFARELARERPDLVRQVITLVSPFAMRDESVSWADRAFRRYAHLHVDPTPRAELRRPIPVPSTSIYSRADGIVNWRDCVEPSSPTHENLGVAAGHLGAGIDPDVLWLAADRLAQPAGAWKPIEAPTREPKTFERWSRTCSN